MDTYLWFVAGIFAGALCLTTIVLWIEVRRKTSQLHIKATEISILIAEVRSLQEINQKLRFLDSENAKLKYQSEAANQVAKVILDSQLQREQDLAQQFESERAARHKAEAALQEELAKHTAVALELEHDIQLIKEALANGERYNRPLYRGKLVPLDKADTLESDVLPRLESKVFRLKR